jgi:hypothetical protein
VPVARCELLDAAAIGAIRAHLGTALVRGADRVPRVPRRRGRGAPGRRLALELAREHGAAAAETATDPAALAALWKARHQAYYAFVAVPTRAWRT